MDEQQGDAEEEELELDGVEFAPVFADDELAACTGVWKLYMRDSGDRGFATPDTAKREVTVAVISDIRERKRRARLVREETVNQANEVKARVTEAHAKLRKEHGRNPTATELFDAVGEDLGKSVQNIRGHARRLELELEAAGSSNGHRDVNPQKIAKSAKPANGGGIRRARRKTTNGTNGTNGMHVDAPEASPMSGVGASLAIMALQTERGRIQSELSAIDKVIERFTRA